MVIQIDIRKLKRSKLYSEELGICLKENNDKEFFKWFLASILFGARISETIAKNTYKTFEKYNLIELKRILNAGRNFLINPIMREGGYVRYDEKTSTQVLKNCETLFKEYRGSLIELHKEAKNTQDLENRLIKFYGIGAITANIFLRELRPFWEKANPEPLARVREIAQKYQIDLDKYNRKSMGFIRIEAGLIRLRKTVQ
jgi:endonuclease III